MMTTKQQSVGIHHFRTYLLLTTISVIIFVVLVAMINILIDAEGRYQIVNIERLNSDKYFSPERGGRVYKSLKLAHNNYDGVILGSSRAEVGLDPSNIQSLGYKVFNAGLSGTNMYEIEKVVDFINQTQKLKFAIIGLDFLMFSSKRKTNGDFVESLFSNNVIKQKISDLKYILSTNTLLKSIKTVYFNLSSIPVVSRDDGFRDKSSQVNNVNHRKLFTDVLKNNFFVNPNTYAAFDYSIDRLSMLENSIRKLLDNDVKVYIFISPVHARQLESLLAINLYDQYNTWKYDLVTIIERLNILLPKGNNLELWDFSGYNKFTTEDVPMKDTEIMSWYWESSHYKKELGDILLNRILKDKNKSSEYYNFSEFGIKLTTNNVKSHFIETDKKRIQYAASHPNEIIDVNLLANQTYNKRNNLTQ